MRTTVHRLFIVSIVCFFPFAILGKMQEKTSMRMAIRYYRTAILIFVVFLVFLALYTYQQGGNFVPPMGTFY